MPDLHDFTVFQRWISTTLRGHADEDLSDLIISFEEKPDPL